jgi:3-deoxy-D-manno-octulosonic-acid transferase
VWFHSCSLGETKALKNITKHLKEPNITVVTNTGFAEAKEITPNVRFLPFEIFLPFWTTEQKALVVMEAELWYMLFVVAKKRNIPTILINARISEKSYPKYMKFKFFYQKIFENIDYIYAQSEIDKQRLESIGAKNVEVSGNIKIATDVEATTHYQKPKEELITAGSTHEGEEDKIVDTFISLDLHHKANLVIVPRHPERFDSIDNMIKEKIKDTNLIYHRFSDMRHLDSDIVLVDTMGELVNIYAISDLVLLCGSFVDGIGGHNPVEVASFGTKIISGEYYHNQIPLYNMVENIEICDIDNLKNIIENRDSIKNSHLKQKTDISAIVDKIKEYE